MNICVFCSSSNAIDDVYFNDAERLGELIGIKGHTLINGGANVGLMEAVTVSARKSGAQTIGIIPERMQEKNLVSNHAHEVEITADMMQRKERMRQMSEAFVALPGGFGTLEEILEVITLKQLDYHRKAIVFVNTAGFFDMLFRQFGKAFEKNFSKEAYKSLYYIAASPEEAMAYIESYEPGEVVTKWFKVPEK